MGRTEPVAFSYKGNEAIEAAVADIMEQQPLPFLPPDDMAQVESDWQHILEAAKAAGLVPAEFVLDDTHGLEFNPTTQEMRIRVLQ